MDERTILKFQNAKGGVIAEKKEIFSFGLHTHTYYEMILYEPFRGRLTVNGTEIDPSRGAAVLISPLDFHETLVDDGCGASYLKVGFDRAILDSAEAESSYVLCGGTDGGLLRGLFEEILKSEQGSPLLPKLIECAACYVKCRGRSICENKRVGGEYTVAVKAAKLLNESFTAEITLASVARRLAVSPQYLSKAFSHSFGVGFSEYLSSLRLKFAAELIKTTDDSITAISLESGFGNFSHFSRAFKRAFGKSPREFRRDSSV